MKAIFALYLVQLVAVAGSILTARRDGGVVLELKRAQVQSEVDIVKAGSPEAWVVFAGWAGYAALALIAIAIACYKLRKGQGEGSIPAILIGCIIVALSVAWPFLISPR